LECEKECAVSVAVNELRTPAARPVAIRKPTVPQRWLWPPALVLLLILAGSDPALAHVKWFAAYDLTRSPMPVGDVFTRFFVLFFLFSVAAIYAFYWVDRYVYRKRILEDVLVRYTIPEPIAFLIMRCAAAGFFGAVSVYGFTGDAFYLTPELKTDHVWVPWLQGAMALCALHPYTVPLMGLGMLVLYAAAVGQYGIFHLLDYLILIGVTYYFLASTIDRPGWKKSRYIVLYAATGLTLLWASIEKWGYPDWTFPLLERDPSLLMGLDARTYMILAGFVEFNLTFVLLSSASLLSRALALGLMSVFVLAIAKFGMIDAIGHLLIIAILAVLVLHGPTEGRNFLVLNSKSLWTEAYFMTGLYVLAFVLIFTAFYGLHYLAYGHWWC
jgi:hypothetical protein